MKEKEREKEEKRNNKKKRIRNFFGQRGQTNSTNKKQPKIKRKVGKKKQ